MIDVSSERVARKKKLEQLLNKGINPFFNHFTKTMPIRNLLHLAHLSPLALTKQKTVSQLAGRIMQIRTFGKLIFARLTDYTGSIQIMLDGKTTPPNCFEIFKYLDRGDIVGVKKGQLIKSHSGELTILIIDLMVLAKSLEPLPEKYHGLVDIESRYRQRYLDLIMNPKIHQIFSKRSLLIQEMRTFLKNTGFLEVETPILQNLLTGASALPFQTFHNALKIPLYLRVAPELFLKRLLVGGFEKVYEIGRLFRNEGVSVKHNPEFTAVEIYQAYADMQTMMELTEKLVRHLVMKVHNQPILEFNGHKIDFAQPFVRVTMSELVQKATGIDFQQITDFAQAQMLAQKHKITVQKHENTVGHILNLFFEHYVEKTLITPTFVYEYPVAISPFAKSYAYKPQFSQRFELFICG